MKAKRAQGLSQRWHLGRRERGTQAVALESNGMVLRNFGACLVCKVVAPVYFAGWSPTPPGCPALLSELVLQPRAGAKLVAGDGIASQS